MPDTLTRDALYRTLENSPGDPLLLAALADWYEEHNDQSAADCLRAALASGRHPGYNDHKFMYGRFFWELHEPVPILDYPPAQLPRRLWEELRENDEPHPVFSYKSYSSARAAYQALIAAWQRLGPMELTPWC